MSPFYSMLLLLLLFLLQVNASSGQDAGTVGVYGDSVVGFRARRTEYKHSSTKRSNAKKEKKDKGKDKKQKKIKKVKDGKKDKTKGKEKKDQTKGKEKKDNTNANTDEKVIKIKKTNIPAAPIATPPPMPPVVAEMPSPQQQQRVNPPCNVCGDGLQVTIPDVEVNMPGQLPTTCALLEIEGQEGFIDPQFCPFVPGIVAPCGCMPLPRTPSSPTIAPSTTLSPTPPTVFAPVPIPPSPGFPPCSVCGVRMLVSLPNAELVIPQGSQQPLQITCGEFEVLGREGFIEPGLCDIFQVFTTPSCGCAPNTAGTFTASPSRAIQPTPAPTFPTFPACSICGEGLKATLPDFVLNVGGQLVTCAELELGAENGLVDPQFCPFPPIMASCGCEASP